jgi:four helix bundle protein
MRGEVMRGNSVCSNLAEAWRKRQYEAMFVNKVSDSEMEAAETQVWLGFAVECHYLDREKAAELQAIYNGILGTLVGMRNNASSWVLPQAKSTKSK